MSNGSLTIEMLQDFINKSKESGNRQSVVFVNPQVFDYFEKTSTLKGNELQDYIKKYHLERLKDYLRYSTKCTKKRLPLP